MRKRITAFLLSAVMIFGCFFCLGAGTDANGTEENDSFYTSKSTTYNNDGTYTITMEGYAKGEVITTTTETTEPIDFVLVLDQSGSMDNGGKLAALKTAVTNFTNQIQQNADKYDVDHRVAIVGFASDDYNYNYDEWENTELLSTTNVVAWNAITNANYADALVSVNVNHAVNSRITTAINRIDGEGATCTEYGLRMAKGIFDNNSATVDNTTHKRIVILFTDGDTYSDQNDCIDIAYSLRHDYGADIYTIGFGASDTDFLFVLSSDLEQNYKIVYSGDLNTSKSYTYYKSSKSSGYTSSTGFYEAIYRSGIDGTGWRYNDWWYKQIYAKTSAADTDSDHIFFYERTTSGDIVNKYALTSLDNSQLNEIFKTIATESTESVSKVTLDTTAVLTDIITDDFYIPNDTDSVKVYTAPCTGESNGELTFGEKTVYNDAIKAVDGNTITVTNFNYAANWCGKQADGNYGGEKLIVEVTVKPVNNGTDEIKIPSNEDGSGIGEEDSDPSFNFDKPTVDTYKYTVKYYKDGVLYKSETSTGRYLPGATVTEKAIDIPGYTVDKSSKSMTIGTDADDNIISFNYTVNKYTVTYDYNDGTTPEATVDYTVNDTVKIKSAPTRDHYKFNGWLIETTEGNWPAKDYTYNGGESLPEMYGNVVLKAKWTAMYGYALNFNPNAGTDTSVSGMPENQPETWSETGTKTYTWSEVPTRTGYTFLGWAESADGAVSSDITNDKSVSVTGTGAELVTKTLYAKWQANDYTITYDANGGTLTGDESKNYTVEDRITIASAPTWDGYTFTGWKVVNAAGNWTVGDYRAMQEINPGMYGNVTLVAQWKSNDYTITYDANGGTLTGDETQSYTVNDDITIAKAPTRDGYTFDGWKLDTASGNWAAGIYSAEQAIDAGKYGDVKLVAWWKENTATINYKVVGPAGCGTVSPASETVNVVNGAASGSTAEATSNTYKFVGWYSDKDCTKLISTDAAFIPAKAADGKWANATYYAKFDWNVADLTITKTGCETDKDPNQSFIFHIVGNGVDMYVTIQGNNSVTIKDLQIGTYTVTEDTSWSWRYTPDKTSKSITIAADSNNKVTFDNERTNNDWIGDSSYAINRCVQSISNAIDRLFGN